MFDIVTVGSAALDVFLRSDEFIIKAGREKSLTFANDKVEVNEMTIAAGGGGTNTAAGLARLGFNCACVARFGGDWVGQWLVKKLAEENFDQKYLRQIEKEKTDYSTILLSPQGERIILVNRGQTRIDKITFPFEVLTETKWLYLASLEGNVALLTEVIKQANENNVAVVLNPGRRELAQKDVLRNLFNKVKVLILNEEEAILFWGKEYQKSLADCQAEIIVVTQGKEGVSWFHQGCLKTMAAKMGKVVDTTGAGDAFSVGLTAGLMEDYLPEKAMKMGLLEAAAVIAKVGAKTGLLNRTELNEGLMAL